MATDYRIDLLTPAGVKVAEFTGTGPDGFLALAYSKRVNEPGLLNAVFGGDNPDLSKFQHRGQVEVWRRNPAFGLPWTVDFRGLWLGQKQATDQYGLGTFQAVCPGQMTMLGWRIGGYPANTALRNTFTSVRAETVMKTMVAYNATSVATVGNGRVRPGAITGLSTATDLGRGSLVTWNWAWDNLLTSLQQLADIAGGDFDLVKTGPQAWAFEFFPGQRGTDRSSTLTFSLDFDTMGQPVYTLDRTREATVAIVGGPGREGQRTIEVVTGRDYILADNDIEVFVNASSDQTVAARAARARAALVGLQAQEAFSYKVLQTPSAFYGVHYGLGDLVKAKYGPVEVTQKVAGVSVSVEDGDEQIDVETRTV